MWDIGPNVNCQLVKRSEDEANFIRAPRGRIPGVIQRHTSTHVMQKNYKSSYANN